MFEYFLPQDLFFKMLSVKFIKLVDYNKILVVVVIMLRLGDGMVSPILSSFLVSSCWIGLRNRPAKAEFGHLWCHSSCAGCSVGCLDVPGKVKFGVS